MGTGNGRHRVPRGEMFGLTGYTPVECPNGGHAFWLAARPGAIAAEGVQIACSCGSLFVVSYPPTGIIIREIVAARRQRIPKAPEAAQAQRP
jgi:hypothetical protein